MKTKVRRRDAASDSADRQDKGGPGYRDVIDVMCARSEYTAHGPRAGPQVSLVLFLLLATLASPSVAGAEETTRRDSLERYLEWARDEGDATSVEILSAAIAADVACKTGDGRVSVECFELWSACQPLELLVEKLREEEAGRIGLTEERIQTVAESRLRAARIYADEDDEIRNHLYININLVGRAFSVDVSYRKVLRDSRLGVQLGVDCWMLPGGLATTWETGSVGTHGGNGGFIVHAVSEHVDRFVSEYLRVNAAACGGPLSPNEKGM